MSVNIKELEKRIKELEFQAKKAQYEGEFEKSLELKEELYKAKLELIKLIKEDKRKSPSISAKELFKKDIPVIEMYQTGIKAIDNHLGGIPRGAFIQLAAGSGAGKTTLMVKILSTLASYQKVLHFDFEMGEYKLHKILPKYLKTETQQENYLINNVSYKLEDLLMEIEYQTREGIKIFMIDSKMKIETKEKDTYKAASLISHELSKLARENKISIILINQISEEALKTGYPSLKGSGDQVYDSDVILYIYKKIIKKATPDNPPEFDDTKRQLYCMKNRYGELFNDFIYRDEVMPSEVKEITPQIEIPEI